MLSVEGEGPYVVLRYREEEEGEIIRWEEGQQISYTYRQLAEGRSEVWVVVDPSRGGRPVPGEVARVRLSGGGRSGMVEVPLECDGGLEHFEVTVDKDTVEYGTTAALRVQAKDREGNDVELDDGELIRMMLRPAVIAGSVKGGSDLKGEMASFKVEGSSGGGMYGSFIVEGSEPVADEVEVGYGVVRQGKVRYLADGGVASGPEPEEVMIVAELVEDETKNGRTVVVVKPGLDHFRVLVDPAEVIHGECAVLKITAVDKEDREVNLAGDELVDVTLRVDEAYGELEYEGRKGLEMRNVRYEDAKGGKVKFCASGENPIGMEPQEVGVGVTKADEPRIAGTGSVRVMASIEKFCQNDRTPSGGWGGMTYDSYKELDEKGNIKQPERYHTIAEKGCALTCMAMVLKGVGLEYDPGKLNGEMTRDSLFTRNQKGNWDGGVYWTAATQYGAAKLKPKPILSGDQANWKSKTPIGLGQIDDHLRRNSFVIVLVGNPDRKDPTELRNHWVLVTGKKNGRYQILDPGCYEGRTTLDSYGNVIYRAVIYERR